MLVVPKEFKLSWLQKYAAEILKMGEIPKHIAIILDGNRRYARKNNLGSVIEGHKLGAEVLQEVAQMLFLLGIQELTVYAFSIENFKRSKEEVDGLMKLLEEKAEYSDEKYEKAKEKGLCLEVIGNVDQATTPDLRKCLKRNMMLSKDFKNFKVNVAFIYTGRDEITQGVNTLLEGLSMGHIGENLLSPQLLQELFTLHPSNPVDMLIRTSGECRLSDFLIWGCSDAYIEFIEGTWPEFNFWQLLAILYRYQNHVLFRKMKYMKDHCKDSGVEYGADARKFVNLVRENKWNAIISYVETSQLRE